MALNIFIMTVMALPISYLSVMANEVGPTPNKKMDESALEKEALNTSVPANFIMYADRLYTGAEPMEQHMLKLKELGFTILVSVDGARPRIAAAEAVGLRYIHLPISYDTVPDTTMGSLQLLAGQINESDKLYIHCHHGKHRGPAVTAIYALITGQRKKPEVLSLMQESGTGAEYTGLWNSVRNYNEEFIEVSNVPPLVAYQPVDDFIDSMVEIDKLYDSIKHRINDQTGRTASHRSESTHEALLLEEALKESSRLLKSKLNEDEKFIKYFQRSIADATQLKETFNSGSNDQIILNFKQLKKSCVDCHADYRN